MSQFLQVVIGVVSIIAFVVLMIWSFILSDSPDRHSRPKTQLNYFSKKLGARPDIVYYGKVDCDRYAVGIWTYLEDDRQRPSWPLTYMMMTIKVHNDSSHSKADYLLNGNRFSIPTEVNGKSYTAIREGVRYTAKKRLDDMAQNVARLKFVTWPMDSVRMRKDEIPSLRRPTQRPLRVINGGRKVG